MRDKPEISIDTKKRELVGDLENKGREQRPRVRPEKGRFHEFLDSSVAKAIPRGTHDMLDKRGWVSVGIEDDTAEFAANSIHRWRHDLGEARFPKAMELLITADGGDGHRTRSRNMSPQSLADELGLALEVRHFPLGTSKWNKIEHRWFSFIKRTWRGKPLVSHQAFVSLFASTTRSTGLIVKAALDTGRDDTVIKPGDKELARLRP